MRKLMLSLCLVSVALVGAYWAVTWAGECPGCSGDEAMTWGDDTTGVLVRETWDIKQNAYDEGASDLHFILWQREDNIYLNGWRVCISDFDEASSSRTDQPGDYHTELKNHSCCEETDDPDNGEHATDVMAYFSPSGPTIDKDASVTVRACFWLTHQNTLRKANVRWSTEAAAEAETKAGPDFGWTVDDPVPAGHRVEIRNDEPSGGLSLTLVSLELLGSTVFYADLKTVPFGTPVPGFPVTLGPGDSLEVYVPDIIPVDGHIYGKFVVTNPLDPAYQIVDYFDHGVISTPPTPSLNKWGVMVLLLLLAASAVVVLHRRRRIAVQ